MNSRYLILTFFIAVWAGGSYPSLAADKHGCPVTRPPNPQFVPPPPEAPMSREDGFFYGTSALWAMVDPHWQLHKFAGQKLPYFRQGYDVNQERDPRLVVVARRVDAPAKMVWAGRANSAPGFMVTGLEIPTAGCWEIVAQYTPPAKVQT